MVQVAKNRYTSDEYHAFIGFSMSKDLLDRAFVTTHSLHLDDVFGDTDLAIGSLRRSKIVPETTRVALLARRQEIVADTPNFNEKKFLYYLSRKGYEKERGSRYRKPGVGTKILAFFLRLMPKVGPFRALSFKIPTTRTKTCTSKASILPSKTTQLSARDSRRAAADSEQGFRHWEGHARGRVPTHRQGLRAAAGSADESNLRAPDAATPGEHS